MLNFLVCTSSLLLSFILLFFSCFGDHISKQLCEPYEEAKIVVQ